MIYDLSINGLTVPDLYKISQVMLLMDVRNRNGKFPLDKNTIKQSLGHRVFQLSYLTLNPDYQLRDFTMGARVILHMERVFGDVGIICDCVNRDTCHRKLIASSLAVYKQVFVKPLSPAQVRKIITLGGDALKTTSPKQGYSQQPLL